MRYFGELTNPKDLVTKEYVENIIPDSLSDLSDDTEHRLVTDAEKLNWNNKISNPATKATGQILKYNGTDWVAADSTDPVPVFNTTITGDGSTTQFPITHTFNTRNVIVQIMDSNYKTVDTDVTRTASDRILVEFATAPASGTTFTVMVRN